MIASVISGVDERVKQADSTADNDSLCGKLREVHGRKQKKE